MDTSSFITSLATSLIIFVILLLLHAVLSRRAANYPVYYPALLQQEDRHPEEAKLRSPTAWLREAVLAREKDIVSFAGLDAAVYIQFQDAALKILGLTALFCVPVLVTISALSDDYEQQKRRPASEGERSNVTFSGFDKLAMGNIPAGSNKIWVFAIGAYWLSLATYLVLWKTYSHIEKLRSNELSRGEAKYEQFAVLVRDIPAPITVQVDEYFRQMHPSSYERCVVVDRKQLRRAEKLYRSIEQTKNKLDACNIKASKSAQPQQHSTGFMGLCGPKVNSVDYYSEQLHQLNAQLEQERLAARSSHPSPRAAIAVFNSRVAAAAAAQCSHSPAGNAWLTSPAPDPREVVWSNLGVPLWQRMLRQAVVAFVVALTILFYMIPIGLVSALTTLDNLQRMLPFIKTLLKLTVLKTVLQAYLPQLALILFLALLPKLLLYLSKLEGLPAQSHIERGAAGKYFYFNVLNVFLGVTLSSSLFSTLKDLQNGGASKLISLLGGSIPYSASFFITFIALKFFVGFGTRFARIVPLIIFRLKKKYLCTTEKDVKDSWAPKPFTYATMVPGDMLVFTIAACYAVIAPMVLPFALTYFAINWLLSRHEALKVVVPAYESSGRMWPHIHSRIIAALLVSQLAMLGYFSIKKFVYTPLLIPLPIATLVFAYASNKVFYRSFKVTPLEVASFQPKRAPSIPEIVDAYSPTPLHNRGIVDERQLVPDATKLPA